jgi:hypothetical protein
MLIVIPGLTRNPGFLWMIQGFLSWIPAFAGMTNRKPKTTDRIIFRLATGYM